MPGVLIYITTFLISMVPIIELRGGIPYGVLNGLPIWVGYAMCVLGSSIVSPILIKFTKEIFNLLRRFRLTRKFIDWVENKTVRKIDDVKKYKYVLFGLFLFVAIPLPGTGAWTGSMIAAFLGLKIKDAFPVIALGNAVAGLIMVILSYYLKVMIL